VYLRHPQAALAKLVSVNKPELVLFVSVTLLLFRLKNILQKTSLISHRYLFFVT
jgi:hypothetical protein